MYANFIWGETGLHVCRYSYEFCLLSSGVRNFATSRKMHQCSKLSPFGESQSFRNGFVTLSRLIYFSTILSHLFCRISFDWSIVHGCFLRVFRIYLSRIGSNQGWLSGLIESNCQFNLVNRLIMQLRGLFFPHTRPVGVRYRFPLIKERDCILSLSHLKILVKVTIKYDKYAKRTEIRTGQKTYLKAPYTM